MWYHLVCFKGFWRKIFVKYFKAVWHNEIKWFFSFETIFLILYLLETSEETEELNNNIEEDIRESSDALIESSGTISNDSIVTQKDLFT